MAPPPPSVQVSKPNPYTFDLGLLLASDPNPLGSSSPEEEEGSSTAATSADALEAQLASTARDGAQALINQLLTTVPLRSTPEGVLLALPPPATPLPREKPLPPEKEPTKWQQFAARKGIKPKTREQRRMKAQTFNEETGEWEKSWGYRGPKHREGEVQQDWLVEVDEKAERKEKEEKQREDKKGKKRRKA